MGDNLDVRNINELEHAIALAQHTVFKKHLEELDRYILMKPTEHLLTEFPDQCIRFDYCETNGFKKLNFQG